MGKIDYIDIDVYNAVMAVEVHTITEAQLELMCDELPDRDGFAVWEESEEGKLCGMYLGNNGNNHTIGSRFGFWLGGVWR